MNKRVIPVFPGWCLLATCLVVHTGRAETTVIFAGDTHFGENYQESNAANGETNILVAEGYAYTIENFTAFLNDADHVVANLETAVTDLRVSPFPTKSYLHYADVNLTPQNLASNNIRAVSLANNHALDFGEQGMMDTLTALQNYGITAFGVGTNKSEAAKPHIQQLQVGSRTVTMAIIGAFEYRENYDEDYQFYASATNHGAYALSLIDLKAQVDELKETYPGVFIVFFPHWGDNYVLKTPEQTRLAHDIIDVGVDMIIGHGAHMLQEVELYRDRWIVYSLGNLVFLSSGRYVYTDAPPYGFALKMVLDEVGSHVVAGFRLYPVFLDNQVTNYKPRFVTQTEFDDVRTILLGTPESAGWSSWYTEGQDAAGNLYFEFPMDVFPPVANIVASPRVGAAPLTVSFDGSASMDPDGPLVDWQWDLGDGTLGNGTAQGHVYASPGVYDVTLTVTSADGFTDTDRIKVVATLPGGGSHSDVVINEVLFDPPAGVAGDANGDGVRSPRGDEFVELVNTGPGTIDLGGWTLAQRDNIIIYTFPEGASIRPGEYVVVFGGVGSAGFGGFDPDLQLFVANPGEADEGFAGANTTNLQFGSDNVVLRDAAGNDIAEVMWNSTPLTAMPTDITSLSGNLNQAVTRDPDLTGEFVQHTTAGEGAAYSPGTDNLGNRGTPANLPPMAAPLGNPGGGPAPLLVHLDGSASMDPDGSLVDWLWDFGDGSSGAGPVLSHVYNVPGTYQITLTVTDHEGVTGATTIEMVVSEEALRLFIQRGPGEVTVSWSPTTAESTLEMSTDLRSGTWTPVSGGDTSPTVLPTDANVQFFRLAKP
jgi:PKD repeat protein